MLEQQDNSYDAYYGAVDRIAQEVYDRVALRGPHALDIDEAIREAVEGTKWVVNPDMALAGVTHTKNRDANWTYGGADLDGCDNFGEVMARLMYWAMYSDVRASVDLLCAEAVDAQEPCDQRKGNDEA